MTPALATPAVLFLASILLAQGQLADVPHPIQGHQLGIGFDIILPLSIAQCEPVLIYYNLTAKTLLSLLNPTHSNFFLVLSLPAGIGYLDWTCNVPSGFSFIAAQFQQPAISFPAGTFPTIMVNPNLVVTSESLTTTGSLVLPAALSSPQVSSTSVFSPSLTSLSVSSPSMSSSSVSAPAASSRKSNKATIAGGIVGGLALVLLSLALISVFLRKRRQSRSDATICSAPVVPFPDQARHLLRTDSIDNVHHGNEPASDVGPMVVPVTQWHNSIPNLPLPSKYALHFNHSKLPPATAAQSGASPPPDSTGKSPHPASTIPPGPPKPENTESFNPLEPTTNATQNAGSDLASALDVASRLTTSQRQTLIASLNASDDPAPTASQPDAQMSMPRPQLSASEAPDLEILLGALSQANVASPDQLRPIHSPRNTMTPPPPYSA